MIHTRGLLKNSITNLANVSKSARFWVQTLRALSVRRGIRRLHTRRGLGAIAVRYGQRAIRPGNKGHPACCLVLRLGTGGRQSHAGKARGAGAVPGGPRQAHIHEGLWLHGTKALQSLAALERYAP